jgi:hypothetical protein
MSALLLQLAGDATVRGTNTHDGMQLLSVSRTGMSRPHPSLERRENGSFRLNTTIRVDHTKFSQVAIKQQHQLIQVLRNLKMTHQKKSDLIQALKT